MLSRFMYTKHISTIPILNVAMYLSQIGILHLTLYNFGKPFKNIYQIICIVIGPLFDSKFWVYIIIYF